MTPEPCTDRDGLRRHLSVNLYDDPSGDGGRIGHTLCSTPGNVVGASDQAAVDVAYDMYLSDMHVSVAQLPPCDECRRAAEDLANSSG
ncbi:hypothetical protein AB0F81_36625 [Actinoplanes sp. NPDC024001]|uniref:hypothetical protein n=1 Tax=Actinoplanes sp. NPDC024001 TaxID=3154598 RepID=UPI0034016BA9